LKLRTGEAIISLQSKEDYDKVLKGKFEVHSKVLEISKTPTKRKLESASSLYREISKEVRQRTDFLKGEEKEQKDIIGDFIYGIVRQYSSDKEVSKITGMILDQPINCVLEDVSSLKSLKERIDQAKDLLRPPVQK
jgi:hypothetical protein